MRNSTRIALGAGTAFLLLTVLVATEWSPLMDLDHDLVAPTTDLSRRHDTYRHVMTAVTWALNSQVELLYVALIAVALVGARRRVAALWLVLVVCSASVLNPLLKVLVGRDRPSVADSVPTFTHLSFPSGHANSAAVVCSALLVVFRPALTGRARTLAVLAAVLLALTVGWTRLTLGAHYLSDIVGGFLFGVAWVALWAPALPGLQRRSAAAPDARS